MRTGSNKPLPAKDEATSSSDDEDDKQNIEQNTTLKARVNFRCYSEVEVA